MGLLEWAAHFKNVRCVLLFDPSIPPPERVLGWLARKHRWREIGVPPSIRISDRLTQKPFVPLSYPTPVIGEVVKGLAPDERSLWLLEGVTLALCYSAPLLCPSPGLYERLAPFSPWTLKAGDVPEGEVVRHLRIAGYVPIDFFPRAVEAYKALKEGKERELEDLIKRRAEEASADGLKRFWRVKALPEGEPLLCYIDLLPLLSMRRKGFPLLLQHEEVGLLLTITTAFFLRG